MSSVECLAAKPLYSQDITGVSRKTYSAANTCSQGNLFYVQKNPSETLPGMVV